MRTSLELARGLTDEHLAAIAALEQRVVAADGGRLKLEWALLRSRPDNEIRDFLCWQGSRLVGFLGIYAFGRPNAEITGMVDPDWRRMGIGSAMLETALPVCLRREPAQVLLIAPRTGAGGREFALACGAVLEHSEHALCLTATPTEAPQDPALRLRDAVAGDLSELSALFIDGFGVPFVGGERALHGESRRTLVAEFDGAPVGVIQLTRDGQDGGIIGFVIKAGWRGRGIGRDVLARACRRLQAAGASRITLEVETENESALALYRSLGFAPLATEDYYRLPADMLDGE
jgi:ribosomal protein S18 acetylase RimI-like enzyme